MKGAYVVLAMLLLTTSIVAVSADSYDPTPIVFPTPSVTGFTGAPALSGNFTKCNATLAGGVTILYPDARPVVVTGTVVTLLVRGLTGGFALVSGTLKAIGPGTYEFIFRLPTIVSGAVEVILPSGSLTDSHGTAFPNVDTVIATYSVPLWPLFCTTELSSTANPGTPLKSWNPDVTRTAQPLQQNPLPQANLLVVTVLAVLSIAGFMLIAPRKDN
jgi:hypothetical protein